jgi:hypothetical protein
VRSVWLLLIDDLRCFTSSETGQNSYLATLHDDDAKHSTKSNAMFHRAINMLIERWVCFGRIKVACENTHFRSVVRCRRSARVCNANATVVMTVDEVLGFVESPF